MTEPVDPTGSPSNPEEPAPPRAEVTSHPGAQASPEPDGSAEQGSPSEPLAEEPAAEEPAAEEPAAEEPAAEERIPPILRPFVPVLRRIDRLPHPPWSSWRGMLLIFVVVAGVGAIAMFTGMKTVTYAESAGFCGTTCHTMEPENKAFAVSPHSDVACGECHVSPGVVGFVKAKLGGTRELYQLVTNTFPTPIPALDHADLPKPQDTCEKCHPIEQITKDGGPTKLIVRPVYDTDEANTRQTISVLLRPYDLGQTAGERGVHWHVQQQVTYTSADTQDQTIDYVKAKDPDGTTSEYIASAEVRVSADVGKDVVRLKSTENNRTMDCYSCHNRVGHEVPSVDAAVDTAMSVGSISPTLPYIKRDSLTLLGANYPTAEAADKAIEGLAATYSTRYPLIASSQAKQISQSISTLKQIYHLVSTPAMNTTATSYANNLGHQGSPGCFRCHDGAHYLIKGGQVTNQVIPSTCDTCHTFPQSNVGPANIPIGIKPVNHEDALWAFDHKSATGSTLPEPGTCGACHAASYCESCHDSGAVKVDHDTMLYNHAKAITDSGGTNACAYCHQTAYCAQCHKTPVLGSSAAALGPQSGSGP